MRDVIHKVIETEAEAKRIIEAAGIEADRILSDARNQARDLVAQSRQEARLAAGKMLETAIQAAEQEKQERLARTAVEIEKQIRLEETTRQRAVDEVIRCVCGRH